MSEGGNAYLYDAVTDTVFPDLLGFGYVVDNYHARSKEAILSYLTGTEEMSVQDVEATYDYVDNLVERFGAFYTSDGASDAGRPHFIKDEETFARKLANIRHVTLEITQECNLRCSYCLFTKDDYATYRSHNSDHLTLTAATKAIDYFVSLLSSDKRVRRHGNAFISFYGGEPLLAFGLIKDIVRYARRQTRRAVPGDKLLFAMTTNGTLLTDEVLRFLVEHEITIGISLDGPLHEHDKHRRTASGKGSFDTVERNIQHLKERWPQYFARHTAFLPTLSDRHDLAAIDSFFETLLEGRPPGGLRVGLVRDEHAVPVMPPSTMQKLTEQALGQLLETRVLSRFMGCIVDSSYLQRFRDRTFHTGLPPFTGVCGPPDMRFFVSSDGNLHVCEKLNQHFPIGDCNTGIQYIRYRKMVEKYLSAMEGLECASCVARNSCNVCFAGAVFGEGFEFSQLCKFQRAGLERALKFAVSAMGANPALRQAPKPDPLKEMFY
jgi:uncharacterized protein